MTGTEKDDEDEHGRLASCFPPGGGRPRLLKEQCPTCVYRPGNKMHLMPGRLADMTALALQQGNQGVICHLTLPGGENPDFGGALCRGFFDKYGPRSNFIRVMMRIGGFTEVALPAEREENES